MNKYPDDLTHGFSIWLLGTAIAETALVVLVVGIYAYSSPSSWVVFSVGIAAACAAAAAGGLAGFLFGVPKVLQSDSLFPKEEARVLANSNLEQISDWLTKILVGVGLVQIAAMPSAFGALGATLAPALGNQPSSAPFAIGIILFSLVVGFLIVYMWTRTQFLEILKRFAKKREEIG